MTWDRARRRVYEAAYRTRNKQKLAAARKRHYTKTQPARQARARQRYQANAAFLAALKDHPCTDCHGVFHHAAMDFDHVRGEKLFCIAANKGGTRASLLAEVAKCDVVCANCHRVRTWQRKQQST